MALFSTTVTKATGYKYGLLSGSQTILFNSGKIHSLETYDTTKSKFAYLIDPRQDKEAKTVVFSSDTVATISGYMDEAYANDLIEINYYPNGNINLDAISLYVNVSDISLGIEYDTYTLLYIQSYEGETKFLISDTVAELVTSSTATTTTTTTTSSTSTSSTSSTTTSEATAYEDFTSYTEVDPESNFTVTSNKLDIVDMHTEHVAAYLYKDFTAKYFTKDFEIQFEFVITDATHGQDNSDMYGIISLNNTPSIRFVEAPGPTVYWAPSMDGSKIDLHCGDATYAVSYLEFNSTSETVFYCTLKRISAANPADCSVLLDVFSDADRTARMNMSNDSPSIQYGRDDIPQANGVIEYRYLQVGTSERDNTDDTSYGSYYVQNIEIISNDGDPATTTSTTTTTTTTS